MAGTEDTAARLRAVIGELAADDAADVLAEAREEARARVRALLSQTFTDAMVDSLCRQLGPMGASPEPPPAPSPVIRDEDEELGWYVYGVVGEQDAAVAGEELTALCEGPVAALARQVPIEEFGETQLRANLGDMEWVERTARAHEDVLDAMCSLATVIPMRMCTVYRTEGGVREMLRRENRALLHALKELDGKAEWGVKVFAEIERVRQLAAEQPADEEDADGDGVGAGTAYLQRQRRERDGAERAAQLIERAASQIHERLCGAAADALLAPAHRPQVSGHPGEMALNGVYLVENAARDQFDQEIESLQAEFGGLGLELQLTGPWPAYNFVPGTIGAAW